jgi:hypothetical protein
MSLTPQSSSSRLEKRVWAFALTLLVFTFAWPVIAAVFAVGGFTITAAGHSDLLAESVRTLKVFLDYGLMWSAIVGLVIALCDVFGWWTGGVVALVFLGLAGGIARNLILGRNVLPLETPANAVSFGAILAGFLVCWVISRLFVIRSESAT